MYEVTLEELSCNETADASEDNCRLEVYRDGQRREPYSLRESMSAGDTWTIDRKFWYENSIRVELHVDDWLFPEDWWKSGHTVDLNAGARLGSDALTTGGSATFDYEGSDYKLTFSKNQQPGPLKPVDKALATFPTSSGTAKWASVDAQPLKDRVETLVDYALGKTNPGATGSTIEAAPFGVYQAKTPFCGPAGIAFSMAAREPRRFVETVRSLYEQGEFYGRNEIGLVSKALRHSSVPGYMSYHDLWAEWVLLGGIRESAHWFNVANNWFLNTKVPSAVHMNLPWTMAYWSQEILGHPRSEWISCSPFLNTIYAILPMTEHSPTEKDDGIEVLRDAKRLHDNGGFASLLVDPGFAHKKWLDSGLPQHWVALGGNVMISGSDVSIEYHDSRDQGMQSETISKQRFNKLVWGAVAGGV